MVIRSAICFERKPSALKIRIDTFDTQFVCKKLVTLIDGGNRIERNNILIISL